jgi:hypothetical protein
VGFVDNKVNSFSSYLIFAILYRYLFFDLFGTPNSCTCSLGGGGGGTNVKKKKKKNFFF